jgi:putative hydrolase of the HAD superfamily
MVGNNLERDIAGANALGLRSVWLDWAPRRAKVPVSTLEVPDYVISSPWELVGLVRQIDAQLRDGSLHGKQDSRESE